MLAKLKQDLSMPLLRPVWVLHSSQGLLIQQVGHTIRVMSTKAAKQPEGCLVGAAELATATHMCNAPLLTVSLPEAHVGPHQPSTSSVPEFARTAVAACNLGSGNMQHAAGAGAGACCSSSNRVKDE